MSDQERQLPQLKDLLSLKTTREQFEEIVRKLLSQKDKELFGPDAVSKVTMGILYPSVLVLEPATFDEKALRDIVGFDDERRPLKNEEVTRLLQITKGTGVIKDAQGGKRLMVDKDIHPIIAKILSYYE